MLLLVLHFVLGFVLEQMIDPSSQEGGIPIAVEVAEPAAEAADPDALLDEPIDTAQPVEREQQEGTQENGHPDPEIDALLDELETADKQLELMRGDVLYARYDAVLDDRQFRWGTLRYASLDTGTHSEMDRGAGEDRLKVFRADFNRYFDGVSIREETQAWVFDGRWLIEQDHTDKRFRKVEITPAQSSERAGFDPMKLGEGPFVIPIGQEKSEILARFEIEQRPVWEGLEAPINDLDRDWDKNFRSNVVAEERALQMLLTPRHDGVSEHDLIRLWYVRKQVDDLGSTADGNTERWVPMLVRTMQLDSDGVVLDQATVQLTGIVINDPRDVVAVMIDEPSEEDGWRVTIDRLAATPAKGESE